MTESRTDPLPQPPEPYRREYEDPQFHDEDLEIQADDVPRRPGTPPVRKKLVRRPLPPRRFVDD